MIRFIDLRYQGTSNRFAFWQTVTDTFYTLKDSQAWSRWDEFVEDLVFEHEGKHEEAMARFRALCPPWVFEDPTDEEEGFRRSGSSTATMIWPSTYDERAEDDGA